jgi:hypothetical protein
MTMATTSSTRAHARHTIPAVTIEMAGLLAVLLLGAFVQVAAQTYDNPEQTSAIEWPSAR